MILNKSLVAPQPFEKHLLNRKRKVSWAKRAGFTALMLTSMVDMFSMLVVFLLQTFSTSPEILVTKGVELPNSTTQAMIKEAPVVAMAKDGILYLDQKPLGTFSEVIKNPKKLSVGLNVIKTSWATRYPDRPFPGEINLQADENIKSPVVAKIMALISASQFESIQLSVVGIR